MGERESSCTIGGNVNWYFHYKKQYSSSSKNKNKKMYLPYDLFIPLLVI